MSRLVPIRITKNDRTEYARLVRNSKAKIARTNKKYGIDLKREISLPSIESFGTRKEFNEWVNKASSFTNRNNTTYQYKKNTRGTVASVREINKVKKDTKNAQRIADKLTSEAIDKPFISGGKVQGTVGQRMLQMGKPNTAGIVRPPDFDFEKMADRRQFEKKKENMEKRSSGEYFDKRMEKMRDSYVEILEKSFNSDADLLIDKIKNIPVDDFYELYIMHDEFDFNDFYITEMTEQTHDHLISQLERYIDDYNEGRLSMDLKGF